MTRSRLPLASKSEESMVVSLLSCTLSGERKSEFWVLVGASSEDEERKRVSLGCGRVLWRGGLFSLFWRSSWVVLFSLDFLDSIFLHLFVGPLVFLCIRVSGWLWLRSVSS